MNITGKLVFALVLAAGFAATGGAIEMHTQARTASTIQLDAVVVTPASALKTIELAAVRVTPTQADRQYAQAHGIRLAASPLASGATAETAQATPAIQLDAVVVTPASAPNTIELAAIRVTPTQADWQHTHAHRVSLPATMASTDDGQSLSQMGAEILMQAISALGPGQFLNTSAALQALDALVFGGNGR